ncbi:aminomethyltransferase family protein [Alkalibacter rhizosphaerae]|uniref:Aminomethyltransferase family protein n=1 Tax=Alkalibacter rhizosphaerae TaxID=2815577 RepID=A0A974XDJ0_9FIRM|nr:aminomethyltransferase family protein [Alkalibacter rhizosphaerae]QSX07671.1 aminomethyltransferase family protein [Alkalibacter rhizosphaerae]
MNKNVYKNDEMKRREHMAVRKSVGWYFWTHQLLQVKGEEATAFLDLIFPNSIANLKVGSARYTTMLNEKAEIIDDVIVFRMEDQKYWISTLFINKLTDWLSNFKKAFAVKYSDISENYQMFAVQGPRSKDLINAIVENNVDDQKFFTIRDNKIDGIDVKINRGGFTGEKFGYEIYVLPEDMAIIEEKLRKEGEAFDAVEVTDVQIMAWSLPTEAGFYYMRNLMHTNPLEVGLDEGINWNKEFVGKEALLQIKEKGPTREMVGFTLDEDDVRINAMDLGGPGTPVMLNGEEIGRVSKFTYSFVLEKNIGYILCMKNTVKPGDHVAIKTYDAVITEKVFI